MAKFYMRELPSGMYKTEGNLCPTIVCEGVVKLSHLAAEISKQTSFTTADVKGLVAALTDAIAYHTAQGRSVSIDGLGSFRASLALDSDKTEEADSETFRNKRSVHVGGVRFRAASAFVKHCNEQADTFERISPKNVSGIGQYDEATRRQKLQEYFAEHGVLTATDYMALTGLNRNAANIELANLSTGEDALLLKHGRRPHVSYTLRK